MLNCCLLHFINKMPLFSDEILVKISSDYCCLDSDESKLIKLLWNIRDFQSSVESQEFLELAKKLDCELSNLLAEIILVDYSEVA